MTDRQARFCEEYLIDLNATQAAIRAGFSPATAQKAKQWITQGADQEKPSLRARVEAARAKQSRRTGVTADRVVRELARVAFASMPDVMDTGNAKIRFDATQDDLAAIANVKVKSGADFTECEIKMADKIKALELLGKHLGMFTERLCVEGGVPVIIDDTDDGGSDGKLQTGFKRDDG